MRIGPVHGIALLSTGLLAGAFGYGAVNLVPTFHAVPLSMRLSFHAELMKMNGITMQAAMGAAFLSSLALAVLAGGRARLIASAAGLLTLASFLTTRFGNVPINGQIKRWAVTSAPAGHAEILGRWELFNDLRTLTALAAFGLLIVLALRVPGRAPSAL
ncbi:anthrone oxygenase family protein [Streptomyces lydicus]|uniref:anthrone oxygenase family protein n=1 Tax=Streptomyces lydicus TaxID=47763 RepID=UPI00378BF1C9